MTYRIAILDDDADTLRRTEEMLSAYNAAHLEHELETACFTQTGAFMESVYQTGSDGWWVYDILVMDIYLSDGNGMECARILREKGYEGIIIFQSSSTEHAVEACHVDARQYLLKPVSQERFFAAMDRVVEELPKCRKRQSVQGAGEPDATPAGNGAFEKRRIYGQPLRYFMDILQTKWNSRRDR